MIDETTEIESNDEVASPVDELVICDLVQRIAFLEKQLKFIKDDKSAKVTVDAKALKEVLQSLIGPQHLIRELQVIDTLPGEEGAISTLVRQFNEAI